MKVKKAINYLQRIYKLGIIDYPRVDNDYHNESTYQFYPHPPLFPFGDDFTSLKEEEIEIKDSPFLYLNHIKILSPANIIFFKKTIDYYFDDNLNLKKKEEFKKIYKIYEEEEKKKNLNIKKLLIKYKSLFDASKTTRKRIYKLRKGFFFNLNMVIERLPGIISLIKSKDKKTELYETDTLLEAIKKEQERIKRKKQLKQRL